MDSIFKIMNGAWAKEALFVAARLNIPRRLKAGPKNYTDLARETSTNPEFLFRLLRVLSSIGVFKMDENGTFYATDTSNAAAEVPGLILHLGQKPMAEAWSQLENVVQTGKTGWNLQHHEDVFEYYAKHPQSLKYFQDTMTEFSKARSGFVSAHDFSKYPKIVDVGGGHGKLAHAIAKAHPSVSVTIFDLPEVVAETQKTIQTEYADVAPRLNTVTGSFFERVPEGADLYTLKMILHDWDDERCIKILKNIHAAIPQHGTVLVLDLVVPSDVTSPLGVMSTFMDMQMMVVCGGMERTEAQWRKLFEAGGFRFDHVEFLAGQFLIFAKKK